MNLMMNGTDAMKDVDGTRELAIRSQPAGNEEFLVSVSDTGVRATVAAGRPDSSTRSLPPSRMGPVWGCPSAAP